MPYCSSSTLARCSSARSNFNKALHDHNRFLTRPLPLWRVRTHRDALTATKGFTADFLSCQTKVFKHGLWLKAAESVSVAVEIPGEKCDMFVGKGALKLPECCCLVIHLLRLLHCVPFRSYLCKGRRKWPQATLSTFPLLSLLPSPPPLIYHIPVFPCHNLHLTWNPVSECMCVLYICHGGELSFDLKDKSLPSVNLTKCCLLSWSIVNSQQW